MKGDKLTMPKRWEERISDLGKAIVRLKEAIEESKKIDFSTLKDGVIQRFEFTLELSWKTLKHLLNSEGIEAATTPKSTVKEAYRLEILKNIDIWLEMLDDRKQSSFSYNQAMVDNIYERILNKYYLELENTYNFLKKGVNI